MRQLELVRVQIALLVIIPAEALLRVLSVLRALMLELTLRRV